MRLVNPNIGKLTRNILLAFVKPVIGMIE